MRTKITLIFSFIFFLYYFTNISSKLADIEKISGEFPSVPEDEWFVKQRAFPFQDIPKDEWLNSMEYVKNNLPKGDRGYDATWTLAGPTNIEGRITTIAIHPINPQIVYAGAAGGGLWKSTNFCQSWVSVFDTRLHHLSELLQLIRQVLKQFTALPVNLTLYEAITPGQGCINQRMAVQHGISSDLGMHTVLVILLSIL